MNGSAARSLALRAAWLVSALLLAFGTAGIGAAVDHLPTSAGRPELTYAADRAIEPGLVAAADDLQRLSAEVDSLADLGRSALTTLVANDSAGLQSAIDAGSLRIADIRARATALRARLAALPGVGPGMEGRLGPAVRARYAILVDALPAVDGLGDAWTRLTGGVVPAMALTSHLAAHDRIAGEAVRLGAAQKYAQAQTTLTGAVSELDAARTIRDQLASHVDTATLDDWIGRNAAFDGAVADLWKALAASKGKATAAVKAAAKRVQTAQAQLPPDTTALVVILGDVARGGLNQAVITIEEARGRLIQSLAQAAALAPPSPGATASLPAGTASPAVSPSSSASAPPSPSSAAPSPTRTGPASRRPSGSVIDGQGSAALSPG